MRTISLTATALLTMMLLSCSNGKTEKETTAVEQKNNDMKNLISIVEIPVTNFPRALNFYQTILGSTIEEADMGDTHMGILASDPSGVNVVIIKGNDYKPSADGAVIYLNMGDDLQPALDKVEKSGGKVIVPKTEISPEMGYFALFIDSEGNRLGLHAAK